MFAIFHPILSMLSLLLYSMQQITIIVGLATILSAHDASAFAPAPGIHHADEIVSMTKRTSIRPPHLNARNPSSSSSSSNPEYLQSPSRSSPPPNSKPKKKNKYANFSKADNLSMDPLDAMINESRTKLREMHSDDSKSSSRKRKKKRSKHGEITSLEAVDQLLTSVDGNDVEEGEKEAVVIEKRKRNKRFFPDTKAIDPYDPTTYGYIELGTIIGAHGVHGLMKLTSITDFSQHRLCQPGIRHIKPPNRRSPREVQLVEGRPTGTEGATIGTENNPMYLIRLETVDDREEALKMRGCVLYALEEEKVDELLEENEYIVSDLVGLNVFFDENADDGRQSGKGFEDLFIGNIRGVVMGSEMCAIPGLGQDLLEVVLPSPHGGQGEDLVLVPFVPEIVTSVNLDGRMVSIMPPPGLLDLSYRREEKVRIKGLLPPVRDT